MRILGVDTTRKIARIFVYDDQSDQKCYNLKMDENIKHSEGLFLYLEKLLNESKLSLNDFDYLSAVVGPGSFTGIRVGMSVIKGFSKCINKKIIPINTFELLGNEIKNGLVLLNSTAMTCYYAKFKNKQIKENGVIDKKDVLKQSDDEPIYILDEEQKYMDMEYNNIVIIDNIDDRYIPCILSKINAESFSGFEPYYIQLSQAERNIKND